MHIQVCLAIGVVQGFSVDICCSCKLKQTNVVLSIGPHPTATLAVVSRQDKILGLSDLLTLSQITVCYITCLP